MERCSDKDIRSRLNCRHVQAAHDYLEIVGKVQALLEADARLLAATFNTLTDSIARFQREISQKERLSSLGRLSTVIAHEIRNPLMIIKTSLHALRQPEVSAVSMREDHKVVIVQY